MSLLPLDFLRVHEYKENTWRVTHKTNAGAVLARTLAATHETDVSEGDDGNDSDARSGNAGEGRPARSGGANPEIQAAQEAATPKGKKNE